jgi:UDP-N-acetylglucosamine--N-acetylmuramyl-(pentapeptide) pyrophosphoryl-undecaprenol N-acetylglucosamine transferase
VPRAMALLRRLRPQVVVSVGGYASVPPVLAARALGIPIVVLSYDAVPGAAARLGSRLATTTAVAFDTSPHPRKVVTGAPLRRAIVEVDVARDRRAARDALGIPNDRFTVLAFGGSLGSGKLNEVVGVFAGVSADRRDLAVRHIVGPRHAALLEADDRPGGRPALVTTERADGLWYQVVRYEDQMHLAYAAADLVVARSGATTVAELAALGVPSVLVPWPLATEDHQTANARTLADAGAAVLVPETELTPERLAREVERLATDRAALGAMAERAGALGHRDAADRIAALVEDVAAAGAARRRRGRGPS